MEFQVGDKVLLKVSPWKGVVRFIKRGKLSPRYVGPFEIIRRIGPVAYQLQLSEEMAGLHDVFHVCRGNIHTCSSRPRGRVLKQGGEDITTLLKFF